MLQKTATGRLSELALNKIDEDIEIHRNDLGNETNRSRKSKFEYRSNSSEDLRSSQSNKKSTKARSFSTIQPKDRPTSKYSERGLVFSRNRNTLRIFENTPHSGMAPLHIINQEDVKRKFFELNIPPVLKFNGSEKAIQAILTKHNKPNFKHFFLAKNILDHVRDKYGTNINRYFEENFGKRVTSKQCINLVGNYLSDNKIGGEITINFAPGLTCSGRINVHNWKKDKPEARKFVVWINDDSDNQFLREYGILCLCDHEIATHYYRSYNEGLQIWFSDRKKFGLRSLNSSELLKIEEGLAALNTLMNAKLKYLYLPAMLYYMACMGHKMTFEQLFRHMEQYVSQPEDRWKQVTRVKRGIQNPNELGVYSRDQCYFEGAIEILEKLDDIDFHTLMCGKLCLDELHRVKRLTRSDCIKLPKFALNQSAYKDKLRKIAIINGIIPGDSSTQNSLFSENKIRGPGSQSEVLKYIDSCLADLRQEALNRKQKKELNPPISKSEFLKNEHKKENSSVCMIL